MSKLNSQQVARAGEQFVAAELHRRGGYAVTFAGIMPEIDILASDVDQNRTVAIQVKTKRTGTWQTSLREWKQRKPKVAETRFWVFVELTEPGILPTYFIVPERWIQLDIDRTHRDYLERHGGHRAKTPKSLHHAISRKRIEQWQDRWDLLGILVETVPAQDVGSPSRRINKRGKPSKRRLGTRELKAEGFSGFIPFKELLNGRLDEVPETPGVYAVLRELDEPPQFLPRNPGGRFKGKDPTVNRSILRARWVEGADVLYVGLASQLRRRIRQFARFGKGDPIGHWGGRYIWQLKGSADFLVAWRETPYTRPREAEIDLLAQFRELHGGFPPFGNIAE